jgi:hypothetical protein
MPAIAMTKVGGSEPEAVLLSDSDSDSPPPSPVKVFALFFLEKFHANRFQFFRSPPSARRKWFAAFIC